VESVIGSLLGYVYEPTKIGFGKVFGKEKNAVREGEERS
jgi:hypothetical protein